MDSFKPTFFKRDAHSLCGSQASRLRSEVGSDKAQRRQPTCHLVQVLIGSPRPERGFLTQDIGPLALPSLSPLPQSPGTRTEAFCFFLQFGSLLFGKTTESPPLFRPFPLFHFVKCTLCLKINFYSCCIFSAGNNLSGPFINGILKL